MGVPTSIVGGIDFDDQEVLEILHLTEASLDGDLSEGLLFALVKALYNGW